MTVSTEVSREEYTGNGVTTDFDYRFRVFSAADLVVSVADTTETISVLTLNTDYTVIGAGSRTGGKVKLMSPLAFNWRISIERALPVTQETDIRNQGNFLPEVHEDAFDKLTMLIQQVWSYFGLALRKPTWLAKFYDAMGNRIANLGNPINQQDAATKSYVDAGDANNTQYADNLFQRTLRVPENSVNQLPIAAARSNSLQGYNDQGQPIPVFAMTDTADLAIRLASHTPGNGGSLVGLEQGGTVQDALKWITPNTVAGSSFDNYAVLQAAADTGLNIDLKAHDIYISQAIQLKQGQRVRGQKSPNFSTSNISRVICNTPGGGCFWYTSDTSKLQVSMPKIDHVGMVGDYPIRFNNEQTSIIADGYASNVPFGMRPCVRFCDINPRVNGIGIGISWSKMFDGIITCCEVANFDID
ncbi:hypothetical protein FOT80_00685, partial [Serratia fonticola]|nr:hypothetical protein [Serratia fonticola]